MLSKKEVIQKVISKKAISLEEALQIYYNWPMAELMYAANEIRQQIIPGNEVTWQIDRNVNISNVCFVQCKFCNFCRKQGNEDSYITSLEEYRVKIHELFTLGGDQLLLQGGMNPSLGLSFYTELFSSLKKEFPTLKLHALGPPEVVFLAKKEKKSFKEILEILIQSGLDSLPGAGAEILNDSVRSSLSKGKCNVHDWLEVMRIAHKMNLYTSATMMFGHIETIEERLQHLIYIREVQEEKPEGAPGFNAFIPWPVQLTNTKLGNEVKIEPVHGTEYIKMIAISRIMLYNVTNIQASWLTVGKKIGSLALHAGANDLGSIMIEENVVSAAGATNSLNAEEMQQLIKDAGFVPRQRNQKYECIN